MTKRFDATNPDESQGSFFEVPRAARVLSNRRAPGVISRFPKTKVLNWGRGVDSTALTVLILNDRQFRHDLEIDSDLRNLVLVTADTGDEFESTKQLAEEHFLPTLAHAGIRLDQIARTTLLPKTTYTLLDSSHEPTKLITGQGSSLSTELFAAGTVPQRRNKGRRCSIDYKGTILDAHISQSIMEGEDYVQFIGFDANEGFRAERDDGYSNDIRRSRYPLLEFGYDRKALVGILREQYGVQWKKSACGFCPFAWHSGKASDNREIVARFVEEPKMGMKALYLDLASRSLNPRQALIPGGLIERALSEPKLFPLVSEFADFVGEVDHSIYEVRRIVDTRKVDKKESAKRSLKKVATGSRDAMADELVRLAKERGLSVDDSGITWRAKVPEDAPEGFRIDHELVVAPSEAVEKMNPAFQSSWNRKVMQLELGRSEPGLF